MQSAPNIKDIYIFSGLGADERVFSSIDFKQHRLHFIQWLIPNPGENISNYAARLISQIKTKNPVLIGLSFGGMMAIEVSKIIPYEKLIVISSIKTKQEIPIYYRLFGQLYLHKLIPIKFFKKASLLSHWVFGVKETQDKKLIAQIMHETDTAYLKWAIHEILHWKNKETPRNLSHIHGSQDKILPILFIKKDIIIKDGGHLIVLYKHEELTEMIHRLLSN